MATQTEPDELILQLVQASFSQSRNTASQLIDSLTDQLADSRAEVDAIRDRVNALLDGPYMPTADAFLQALWPSRDQREMFRQEGAN